MRSLDNISCLLFDTSFVLAFACLPCVPTLIETIKNSTFLSWLFYNDCGGEDKTPKTKDIQLSKEQNACQAMVRELQASLGALEKEKGGSWVKVPGTSAEITFDAGLESRVFNRMMDACEKGHIVVTADHPFSVENVGTKVPAPAPAPKAKKF